MTREKELDVLIEHCKHKLVFMSKELENFKSEYWVKENSKIIIKKANEILEYFEEKEKLRIDKI